METRIRHSFEVTIFKDGSPLVAFVFFANCKVDLGTIELHATQGGRCRRQGQSHFGPWLEWYTSRHAELLWRRMRSLQCKYASGSFTWNMHVSSCRRKRSSLHWSFGPEGRLVVDNLVSLLELLQKNSAMPNQGNLLCGKLFGPRCHQHCLVAKVGRLCLGAAYMKTKNNFKSELQCIEKHFLKLTNARRSGSISSLDYFVVCSPLLFLVHLSPESFVAHPKLVCIDSWHLLCVGSSRTHYRSRSGTKGLDRVSWFHLLWA